MKIRIGILGCANIARKSVIPAIKALNDRYELMYVASRTMEKADAFAAEFNCCPLCGYEALVAAEDVDALYIPLPTGLHVEWVNRALQSGKHVYAEKSIARCHADALQMVNHAKAGDLALMEGYMFLYHAQQRRILDLIGSGAIGEIRHFSSSFGFPPLPKDNFRYSEEIGGGALLDAAGYTVRAAHLVLGPELKVRAASLFVDPVAGTSVYGSAFMSNAKGVGASLSFGFDNFYQCRYEIWGSKGKLSAERAFTPPPDMCPRITLETASGSEVILADADNHFIRAFEEFHRVCGSPELRQEHYAQVLRQSQALDQIRKLGS